MSWLVCAGRARRVRARCSSRRWSSTASTRARSPLGADEAERRAFPVVVIGCGQSGLLAGIRLKEAGIPFTIVEKNAGVGGTWYENTYPGCRVDVGNHFYCYSFEPSDHWSEFFAQPARAAALLRRRDANATASTPHVRWETEVVARASGTTTPARGRCASARPTGPRRRWPPGPSSPPSASSTGRTCPTSPAVTPSPDPSFHSARWDHDVDLDGKRVALDRRRRERLPDRAGHRRPRSSTSPSSSARRSGCSPTRTTTSGSGPGVQWALRHLPFYGRWYRFLIFWPACDGGLAAARVDPAYAGPAAGGQRDQRAHPADVHRLDHQPGRRRPRPAGQGRARLPGHRQAHAAGQRQLAAHAHPRRRRPRPRRHRPHRGRRHRHRRRASATRST